MQSNRSTMNTSLATLILAGALVAGCGGDSGEPETGSAGAGADSLAKMQLVLARVGDIEITGADIKNHMLKRSSPQEVEKYLTGKGGPDILQVALASLLDQYVWSETAKKAGFELNEEDQHQVRALESELLATRYVGKVIQGKANPSREQVEDYYLEHQAQYMTPHRVGVRHILVKTRETAEDLKTRAMAGEDFADLAKRYSTDENTRDFGGALGFVQRGQPILGMGRDPAFQDAILAMDEGEYAVLKTDRGWHVVYVEQREGGEMIPIEDVYENISQLLTSQNFGPIYNDALSAAREATGATFVTENFEIFSSTSGNTNRLLHLAHDMRDMGGRIEAYRRLSYDFPDSREAAEAQFMLVYLAHTALKDPNRTERELRRLKAKFPRSTWKKAGLYLEKHLDDPVETLGTPKEIYKAAQ